MSLTAAPSPMIVPDKIAAPAPLAPLPLLMPDNLTPPPVSEARWYRWTWLVVAIVVLAAYSAFVFRFWDAADDGVDQNAYLVGGRLLAEHGTMKYVLPNPYAYVGSMFVRMPDGTYFPKYPVGLPLLYAMFFWGFKIASVLPWLKYHVNPNQAAYWAFLVSPLSAIAAVAGTFLIARRLAGSFPGVMAAILLGTSQLMISLAANANSHASCTAFTVWGMYALICWQQKGGWWKGLLGGLLIGFAATIRYSEFLLVIPVGFACLGRMRWNQSRSYIGTGAVLAFLVAAYFWAENYTGPAYVFVPKFGNRWWYYHDLEYRTLAGVALSLVGCLCCVLAFIRWYVDDYKWFLRNILPGLGWAVPFGGMLVFNLITMHTATGYDATHESGSGSAFAWAFFYKNWEKAVRSLYDLDAFFVLPVGVVGIVMLFRRSWQTALTLTGWLVPGVLLYMFYYWSMDFDVAYARFFLTFIPAIAIGAAVCFNELILRGRTTPALAEPVGWTLAIPAAVAAVCAFAAVLAFHQQPYSAWPLSSVQPHAVAILLIVPAIALVAAVGRRRWAFNAFWTSTVAVCGLLIWRVFSGLPHSEKTVYTVYILVGILTIVGAVLVLNWQRLFKVSADSAPPTAAPLTLAIAALVAIAAGINCYRAIHGLRDGQNQIAILGEQYTDRMNYARTGQELLAHVPSKSLLFLDDSGFITKPMNYIQFLNDWDVIPEDAFAIEGEQKIRRFTGGRGRRGRDDEDDTQKANPLQKEQEDYQISLYHDYSKDRAGKAESSAQLPLKDLRAKEVAAIDNAINDHRRVFVCIGTTAGEDHHEGDGRTLWFPAPQYKDIHPVDRFEKNLNQFPGEKFQYKVVDKWQDTSNPPDKDPTDDDPGFPGGNMGRGMMKMFMNSGQVRIWELVEITPVPATAPVEKKAEKVAKKGWRPDFK
jgi:4-amino-4-deoxy-L-arabinose transferase-like glycosyltransferase